MTRARLGVLSALLFLQACGEAPPPSEDAAHIENPVLETDLTTVHLTESAVQRIGIEVGRVERRELSRTRSVGGELVAPSGSEMTVTSPGAAIVLAPASGPIPNAGAVVAAGQPVLRLAVLAQNELAGPQQALAAAEARLENARAKADRARVLLADSIASRAEFEDAVAELRTAETAAEGARARAELLSSGHTGADISALAPVVITAPRAGRLLAVYVGAGQTVGADAPLATIVDVDPLWVRVPVFPSDADLFDSQSNARVDAGANRGHTGLSATPIRGPATANAASASIDLFYEMANPDGRFRPGERVSVRIPLRGSVGDQLVVPWGAVVIDIYGGAWVYEDRSGGAYTRRRVEVVDVVDGLAVLARGVAAGTSVVIVGAAELFSTEFGGDTH